LFNFIYLSVGWLLYVAAFPLLILLSFFPKYRRSVPARFFLVNNPPFAKEPGVWFHACSLGEVNSLKPLLKKVTSPSRLSVITQTGYDAATKLTDEVRFLPFEIFLPFWVRDQKALVVLEAELWYMLFVCAKRKGIPTYLLNARISDRSYPRYRRFKWFYKSVLSHVDTVFVQSRKDAERFKALGAERVVVLGNIKTASEIVPTRVLEKPKRELVTLASTHEGEELLLLDALNYTDRTVVVVPRHPERFETVASEVARFSQKRGLSFHCFSEREDFESDIVLMDRMGELINLYAISDVVLLGGSFVKGVGGHNPLEPAHFGVRLISGKHIFNQEALFPMVENVRFAEVDEIEEMIEKLEPSKISHRTDLEPFFEVLNTDVV
jgi:3-deoxy-D-manno-octulosonic-acid transferase